MPCFTLKVHNFDLAKSSVTVSTGVYSIRFQKMNSPAAGTEVIHLRKSKGSVMASYSATNKYYYWGEQRNWKQEGLKY